MKALKLIFFADRYHLRKYGRPVSGDRYYAMKNGPVASEAMNLAKLISLPDPVLDYAGNFIVPATSPHRFATVANFDPHVFSETDIEALRFSWDRFGKYAHFQLSELTHLYPEWARHRKALKTNLRAPMSFLDFFQDPIGNADPCHYLSPEDRDAALEIFKEEQSFADALRN